MTWPLTFQVQAEKGKNCGIKEMGLIWLLPNLLNDMGQVSYISLNLHIYKMAVNSSLFTAMTKYLKLDNL